MSTASQWSKMPADVQAAIQNRQIENGFSDIDGLHQFIEQLWADYNASRATTGRLSLDLKELFKEARERAWMSKALIDVMGDSLQDLALGNTVLFDAKLQEILPYLDIPREEIEGMSPKQKISMFKEIGTAASRMASNYKKIKDEKRADAVHRAEMQQRGGSSDDHKRALMEKMEMLLLEESEA